MRTALLLPAVCCCLCAAACRDASSPPAAAPGRSDEVGARLADLESPDARVRDAARRALIEMGPVVLGRLCPFIRKHLDDPAEHAWRAACDVEEQIALRYQHDEHLDDYYRTLRPARLASMKLALPGGAEIELLKVPAGSFIEGSSNPGTGVPMAADLPCSYAPVRKVTISRPFWIGRDEVTQRQWQAVMGFNRSREKRPHLAVELISWAEGVEFCRRLSAMNPPLKFTLPTEAQWEYACRAGTTGRHAFGNRVLYRADARLAEGGEFHENRWGLRHVHDSVFEWCLDWYGQWSQSPATDPAGPPAGQERSIRSNYTFCSAAEVRCAHRVGFPPRPRHGIGMRVVCKAR